MSDLVVRPVRFTDNVDSMRAFLITLGLQPRVESVSGGWVDMVASGGESAGGGMVALHSAENSARRAPSGLTSLSFEADDVDVLAKRLEAAGVPDVTVYDEAYGRVLTCRDPLGDEIVVDERSTDLYGYRLNEQTAGLPGWRVLAIRFTDPMSAYGGFLESLGLERRGEPDEHFAAFTPGGGEYGVVGLHPRADNAGSHLSEVGAVRLCFETMESPDAVAERLADDGCSPTLREEAFGQVLTVVDGDGLPLEVHGVPGSTV